MPSIYQLKPAFQNTLRPLVRALARGGVTANQVTVAAVLLSLVQGLAFWFFLDQRWPFFTLPLVLFLRMALNAIDGMLAREHHQKSRLGAILNELGDVLGDAALYLPLAAWAGLSPVVVVLFVIAAILTEMTGVLAQVVGSGRRYDGPMGKSDRAFVCGTLAFFGGFGLPAEPYANAVLGLATALAALTVVNRARRCLEPEP